MHDLKPYVAGEQPRIAGWSSSTPMKVHLVLPHARWKPFAARRPILASISGLTGHYLRISVGTDGQIDRLMSALSDILGNT